MNHFYKPIQHFLLLLFLGIIPLWITAQSKVSYAYDYAGNRISRQVVNLSTSPPHLKKQMDSIPAPVKDKLGDRIISIYPNPTKGALAVEISAADSKDELSIALFSSQGVLLQSLAASSGKTPVEMSAYPPGWYILRVKAGEKLTEFKIVKQ